MYAKKILSAKQMNLTKLVRMQRSGIDTIKYVPCLTQDTNTVHLSQAKSNLITCLSFDMASEDMNSFFPNLVIKHRTWGLGSDSPLSSSQGTKTLNTCTSWRYTILTLSLVKVIMINLRGWYSNISIVICVMCVCYSQGWHDITRPGKPTP